MARKYGVNKLFQSPNWQKGIEGSSVDITQKTKFILDEEGMNNMILSHIMKDEPMYEMKL